MSAFLAPVKGVAGRTLATFAVITTAEVWFPLNILASGALLALAALGVWGLVKDRPARRRFHVAVLGGTAILVVTMYDFLRSSIEYALGIGGSAVVAAGGAVGRGIGAVDVPSLPLFAQPGGTETVTDLLILLAVISVLGAVALPAHRRRAPRRAVLPFLPIIALVLYAALVTLADFWAIGSGPNYASKKILFAIAIPILAATLPFAVLALGARDRRMTTAALVRRGRPWCSCSSSTPSSRARSCS